MTTYPKLALAAAIITVTSIGAFADTGRPSDYVACVPPIPVVRHADDAFARYQAVLDGPSRSASTSRADADDQAAVDSYARYLMVVDGTGREAAIDRARLRRQSMTQIEERRLARANGRR